VVLDEGVIVGVGKGLRSLKLTLDDQSSVTAAMWGGRACEYLALAGQHVTPGLVEAHTQLGVVEVSLEPETRDSSGGDDPIRAGLVVTDAYSPRSTLIDIQRAHGVTSAVVAPTDGLFSGIGGWVNLDGETQAQAVIHRKVAQFATIKFGASRAEAILRLREAIEDAVDYRRNRGAYDRNQRRDYAPGASRVDLAALADVASRRLPLVVRANRAADIESLLRLRKEMGFKMVILGGAEAWILAEELAAAGVGVILNPYVVGPGGFDQVYARADNARLLDEAGVVVALTTGSSHNVRILRQVAGNAVRGGLDHAAAVQAISSNIATLYGLTDVGSISVGKVANLVVWSGDPLEFSSWPEQVYINGKRVSLENRQTKLLDRYRTLPVSRAAGLTIAE
jgi:imidazolonepropionase-like amidohydrolase